LHGDLSLVLFGSLFGAPVYSNSWSFTGNGF
jgi:hypothetical protein